MAAKIKLEKALHQQASELAERLGYSSVDEFVTHLLEKAIDDAKDEESDEAIRKRLQGLGYLG